MSLNQHVISLFAKKNQNLILRSLLEGGSKLHTILFLLLTILFLHAGNHTAVAQIQLNVAILAADDPLAAADVQTKLLSTGNFNTVDIFDVRFTTPTLNELINYDAVLVWSMYPFDNIWQIGDELADYVDNGGGVVCATTKYPIKGRFDNDDYKAMMYSAITNYGGGLSLGSFDPNHYILNGVSSFDGRLSIRPDNVNLASGADVIAVWTDGTPLIVAKEINGVNRVDLGFYPPSSDVNYDFWDSSTDGAIIMANSLIWASGKMDIVGKLNVAILAADDPSAAADVQTKLYSTGDFHNVDIFDVRFTTPTLATLINYDAVLVWSAYPFQDPWQIGHVLADYVDYGGGVVCATTEFRIEGRFDIGYKAMNSNGTNTGGSLSLGAFDPSHFILDGVSSFDGGLISVRPDNVILAPDADVIAEWTDGTPLIVAKEVNGVNRVDLGFYPPSSDEYYNFWYSSTDGAIIMGNSLIWASVKIPRINLGSSPEVCQGTNTAYLTYSATTNNPDRYSITFDELAINNGFVNVTEATLGSSPIFITVPFFADVETYNASLTVKNNTNGLTSRAYPITVTVSEPVDTDGDGICNTGDTDDDNDGEPDVSDSDPLDPEVCSDNDNDGCDECSQNPVSTSSSTPWAIYTPSVSNDGTDTDGDGICDTGDTDDDNDGVADVSDSNPVDPQVCTDTDSDGCDECSQNTVSSSSGTPWAVFSPNSTNDGDDFDADGQCDSGDADDDNDGVVDIDDVFPFDSLEWADTDNDGTGDNSDPDANGNGINDASELVLLTDSLNLYKTWVASLQNDSILLYDSILVLNDTIYALLTDTVALNARIRELQAELADSAAIIQLLRQDTVLLITQIATLEDEIESIEQQLANLSTQVSDLENDTLLMSQQITALQSALSDSSIIISAWKDSTQKYMTLWIEDTCIYTDTIFADTIVYNITVLDSIEHNIITKDSIEYNIIIQDSTEYNIIVLDSVVYNITKLDSIEYNITTLDSIKYNITVQDSIEYNIITLDSIGYNIIIEDSIQFNIIVKDSVEYNYITKDTIVYDTVLVSIIEVDMTTAVSEALTALGITIAPNPAKEYLVINATQIITKLSVYDIAGSLVLIKEPNSTDCELHMSELSGTGTYILKTETGGRVVVVKAVFQ